jgi:predicted GNAT family acetyltransferase
MAETALVDNQALGRFEWCEQGRLAFADYRRRGEVLVIPHVEADVALRGTGAAGRLMQALAADVRSRGLKLTPVCSYAVAWFRRHPEAADLLA